MRTRTIAVLAVTLAAGLLAAGCGSDDGDDSAGGSAQAETPTKNEYIAAADGICEQNRATLKKLAAEQARTRARQGEAGSAQEAATAAGPTADNLDEIVAARTEITTQLKALDPPAEGGADAYIQAREAADAALQKEAAALRKFASDPSEANSAATTEANQAAFKAGEQPQEAAEAYGFEVCGQPVN